MQAMDIANDALDKVLENIKTAFQLSIPVLSIVLIISAAFSFSFWLAVYSGNDSGVRAFMSAPLGMARAFAIPVLLIVIGVYWITVAWHRFVILEEKPAGILPKLHLGCIWGYLWRLVVLSFVIGIVIGLPLAILSNVVGGGGQINIADYSEALKSGPVAVIINMVGTAAFAYVFMRYSPFLVAAAIGQPIKASTGRESTYWARKAIFVLAIGYAVMSLLSSFIGGGLSTGFWPIDLAIVLVLQWVGFMFTISLLTTIYQKSAEQYADTSKAGGILT